jgi:hypothetical protein
MLGLAVLLFLAAMRAGWESLLAGGRIAGQLSDDISLRDLLFVVALLPNYRRTSRKVWQGLESVRNLGKSKSSVAGASPCKWFCQ